MDYIDPIVHLARGLSDSVAIDSLLTLNRLDLNLALAVNRNLKERQLTTLLETYNTLQRVNTSPETELGVLLASRYDLTTEQMWAIVKGRSVLARQSLLSRLPIEGSVRQEIDPEIFEYILKSKWYSEDYGQEMRHSAFNFAKTQIWRLPNRDAHLYNSFGRMPNSRNPATPRNRAYAVREAKIWQSRQKLEHGLYSRPLRNQNHLATLVDDLLSSSTNQLRYVLGRTVIYAETFTVRVQQLIGKEDSNFYALFFEMLPSWGGPIPELVSTTKSLTSSPVAKR